MSEEASPHEVSRRRLVKMRRDKWTLALARVLDRIRIGPRRKVKRIGNWQIVSRLPAELEDGEAGLPSAPRNRNLTVFLLLAGILAWLIVQPPIFFPKARQELALSPSPALVPALDVTSPTPEASLKPAIPEPVSPAPLPPVSIRSSATPALFRSLPFIPRSGRGRQGSCWGMRIPSVSRSCPILLPPLPLRFQTGSRSNSGASGQPLAVGKQEWRGPFFRSSGGRRTSNVRPLRVE